jgi:hypothetical protein
LRVYRICPKPIPPSNGPRASGCPRGGVG